MGDRDVLGISREASEKEIKKAFRKIALECHPDRHVNSSTESKARAATKFQAASKAYESLLNTKQGGYGQQNQYQQQYSYRNQTSNPYGQSFYRTRHSRAIPKGNIYRLMSALTRNMTRTDAIFHVGLASLLTFGAFFATVMGDSLWSKWNQGHLYEDVHRRVLENRGKTPTSALTSAQAAANMAAGGGRPVVHDMPYHPYVTKAGAPPNQSTTGNIGDLQQEAESPTKMEAAAADGNDNPESHVKPARSAAQVSTAGVSRMASKEDV